MIISGGVKVPGAAVASRLRAHPSSTQAAVVGVPDEEWGERVVAFVVLVEPGSSLDATRRDWVG